MNGATDCIANCGQIASVSSMANIDNLQKLISSLFDGTIADFLWTCVLPK